MHRIQTVDETIPTHPPRSMEKLPFMEPVPGAQKVGGCWFKRKCEKLRIKYLFLSSLFTHDQILKVPCSFDDSISGSWVDYPQSKEDINSILIQGN